MAKLSALLTILLVSPVLASDCTDACDAQGLVGAKVLFCGTDFMNHVITYNRQAGTSVMKCYRGCGISAASAGECACPNYCSQPVGQGFCLNGACLCNPGWGGVDCSVVRCPQNACSGNGVCVSGNGTAADYCACRGGWTGPYCDIAVSALSQNPLPSLFAGDRPYYSDADPNGDASPAFDLSVVATVRVTVDPGALQYLLNPFYGPNQTYAQANLTFDNGRLRQQFVDVGLKLKGSSTREYLKKGWNIAFDKFKKKQQLDRYTKIGLKYAYPDDSILLNLLVMHMHRAINVPVFRGSYASLWINDQHWGVLWMQEDLDELFLASRYPDPSGNFYMNNVAPVYLEYLGDDPKSYKNATDDHRGAVKNTYDQVSGNGDFSDLARLIKVIATTDDAGFVDAIEQVFDVERFLRLLVVENFFMDTDTYSRNGNNFALYNNPATKKFEFLSHDFDFSIPRSTSAPTSVYEWFKPEANLTRRIMSVDSYRRTYTKYYWNMVGMLEQQKELILGIMSTAQAFLYPEIQRDMFYRLDFARTPSDFVADIDTRLAAFYPLRIANVSAQLVPLRQDDGPPRPSRGLIVGLIVGGVVLAAAAVAVGVWVVRWRRRRSLYSTLAEAEPLPLRQ